MNEENKDISTDWELATFTFGFIFNRRIIRYRKKNLVGTYIYKVQCKYPIFGWTDIIYFNTDYDVH
jgi:hypothetical protein